MSDTHLTLALALIGLLGSVVTYVLVPWIKTKTTQGQRDNVKFWVETVVTAVEKHYEGQPGKGLLKKEQVVKFIMNQGYDVTEEQLSILIDAAVEELINKPRNLSFEELAEVAE